MDGQFVCQNCGYIGKPKKMTKGSFVMEIVLWCLLFIPGIIYSMWRVTSRYKACPSCGGTGMIPAESPMGRKLVEQMGGGEPQPRPVVKT